MKNNSSLNLREQNESVDYRYNSPDICNTKMIKPLESDYTDEAKSFDYKSTSDEILIRKYLEDKDEGSFNEIVDRYGWKIHRLAFRITHDTRNADDVLQDVFLIIVEKSHTFRGDSKFTTWLYRVAVNISFMHLKKKIKYELDLSQDSLETYYQSGHLEGADLKEWSFIPDDVSIRREELEKIENAMSEMPKISQTIFHLSVLDGHTNAEIGEILGLTLPAVKSRLRRAKLFLRSRLEADFLQHC